MKMESKLLDWQSSQPTGGTFFRRELHRSLGSAGEAGLQVARCSVAPLTFVSSNFGFCFQLCLCDLFHWLWVLIEDSCTEMM